MNRITIIRLVAAPSPTSHSARRNGASYIARGMATCTDQPEPGRIRYATTSGVLSQPMAR